MPYRGEGEGGEREHRHHHPTPLNPNEKKVALILLLVFGVIGTYIGYLAFTSMTFLSISIFFIYLMTFVTVIVAVDDLKNIKKITPQPRDDQELDEREGPSLAEDYFAQIDWVQTHRKRHHPSRWDAPEPKWRYRRVAASNRRLANNCLSTFVLYGAILLAIFVIMMIFKPLGTNAPVLASILISITVAGICIYLIRQN